MYTPIMIAFMITGLKTDNYILIYVMKELSNTSLGKAISTATTSSIMFVVMMLVLEKQYESVANVLHGTLALLKSGGAAIIIVIGICILLESLKSS